jgi:hypothetical protein
MHLQSLIYTLPLASNLCVVRYMHLQCLTPSPLPSNAASPLYPLQTPAVSARHPPPCRLMRRVHFTLCKQLQPQSPSHLLETVQVPLHAPTVSDCPLTCQKTFRILRTHLQPLSSITSYLLANLNNYSHAPTCFTPLSFTHPLANLCDPKHASTVSITLSPTSKPLENTLHTYSLHNPSIC